MLDEAEREDTDSMYDKERNKKELDLKIMEQIKESNRRRTMKRRTGYDS